MSKSTCARILLATTCVLALATSASAAFSVRAERVPDGKYCGDYASGLVTGRLRTEKDSDRFDITIEAFDEELVCKDEEYHYDPKTHTADIPGARDPEGCIGRPIQENGLILEVSYNPKKDIITLDLGIAKIDCIKC